MAVVAFGAEIYREGSAVGGGGSVDGAGSSQLVAMGAGWFEVALAQDLIHGDLGAKLVEVDARHGGAFPLTVGSVEAGPFPFPFYIGGTGNACYGGQLMRSQPVGVRRILPACSRNSRASPRRSFLTERESRSFVRVRSSSWARRASTCSWRRCCRSSC